MFVMSAYTGATRSARPSESHESPQAVAARRVPDLCGRFAAEPPSMETLRPCVRLDHIEQAIDASHGGIRG